MSDHDAYRDGRIHVCADLCSTCVFRPGNLMGLQPGRLRGMVDEALADEAAIICHKTLYGQAEHNAICRGFYDRHETLPLQLAKRLGLIELDEPPA